MNAVGSSRHCKGKSKSRANYFLQIITRRLATKTADTEVEEKAAAVQAFYETCETRYRDCAKRDGQFMEKLEAQVMQRLLPSAYEDEDGRIQDRVLLEKISLYSEMDDESSPAESILDEAALKEAQDRLVAMNSAPLPREKLEILMEFIDGLCKAIERHGSTANADVLLPVLTLAIIKSRPEHIITDLRFIQRFRNHSRLTGRTAYNLTNVLAVVSLIESAKVEEMGQGETIYSLVTKSATDLQQAEAPVAKDEAEKPVEPQSPSMLMKPLTEINAMASTVFTKVTFYPRALSSAVADTFRRAKTAEDLASPRPIGSKWVERTAKHPDTDQVIEEDLEIRAFRHRIMGMTSFDEMTVREIPMVFADYRKLLMTFCFEPDKGPAKK